MSSGGQSSDRQEFRDDPPQQPRGNGSVTAVLQAWGGCWFAGPHRSWALHDKAPYQCEWDTTGPRCPSGHWRWEVIHLQAPDWYNGKFSVRLNCLQHSSHCNWVLQQQSFWALVHYISIFHDCRHIHHLHFCSSCEMKQRLFQIPTYKISTNQILLILK